MPPPGPGTGGTPDASERLWKNPAGGHRGGHLAARRRRCSPRPRAHREPGARPTTSPLSEAAPTSTPGAPGTGVDDVAAVGGGAHVDPGRTAPGRAPDAASERLWKKPGRGDLGGHVDARLSRCSRRPRGARHTEGKPGRPRTPGAAQSAPPSSLRARVLRPMPRTFAAAVRLPSTASRTRRMCSRSTSARVRSADSRVPTLRQRGRAGTRRDPAAAEAARRSAPPR